MAKFNEKIVGVDRHGFLVLPDDDNYSPSSLEAAAQIYQQTTSWVVCKNKKIGYIVWEEGRAVRHKEYDKTNLSLRLHRFLYEHDSYYEALSDEHIVELSNDVDWRLRRVSAKETSSKEILEKLAKDPVAKVRIAVLENPKTPRGLVHSFETDEDADVRESLISSDHITVDILDRMAVDANEDIRASVAMAGITRPETLDRLSHEFPSYVLSNKRTPKNTLERLFAELCIDKESTKEYAGEFVGNPNTPSSVLEAFIQYFPVEVAEHKNASSKQIQSLLTHVLPEVRRAALSHPRASIKSLVEAASGKNPDDRAAVANNKKLPVEWVEKLASDRDVNVRHVIVDHPKLSEKSLRRMAADVTSPNVSFSATLRLQEKRKKK